MLTLRKGDFEAFFQAPFQAYGSDSLYVSPMKSDLKRFLDPAVNPGFASHDDVSYFTVHQSDRVVGRITAHVHHASNIKYGIKRAYFGYFDCADNPQAAAMLLHAAEEWAVERGKG